VTDWLLLDSARRILADTCTHEAVQEAEAVGWSDAVWTALERSGYGDLTSIDLEDALALLTLAGEYAAPVPLAEAALAGWLLGTTPPPSVSVAPRGDLRLANGAVSGTAQRVPWGRAVEHVVVVIDGQAVVLPTCAARIEQQTNIAGEPRDLLVFEQAVAEDVRPVNCDLIERGALTRAAMMSGALTAMARLTIAYAADRRQFGRPIASFQAVQQHLVAIAQDASLVAIAAQAAAQAAKQGRATFEIAAAKLLASQAALTATRAAHQVHGAMGMTQEYRLHQFSRRLWAWRSEYADEQSWVRRIGRVVASAGADQLYPAITGGSAVI
jgi:acyl-CoA dehydrogenase